MVTDADWAGWLRTVLRASGGVSRPTARRPARLAPGGFYAEEEPVGVMLARVCNLGVSGIGSVSRPTSRRPRLLANRLVVGGERGLGRLVVNGFAGIEGGMAQRPAVRGCWQTGWWLVVNADWAGWLWTRGGHQGWDGPTTRRPRLLANQLVVGGEHGLVGLVLNGLMGFRRRLSPNGPPSAPARAGGLLLHPRVEHGFA